MNFFGVGGAELMAILIIMLVVAGPKRMIHWSYLLGKQVAKFRKVWSQTVDLVQKEFDEAGVGIQLPKEPPTRQNLNKALGAAIQPVTKPLEDSISEVKKDADVFKEVSDTLNEKQPEAAKTGAARTPGNVEKAREKLKTITAAKPAQAKQAATNPAASDLGSWSADGEDRAESSVNGSGPDLGAWSATGSE